MISIFVSHAWHDDALYQRFASLLYNELGRDGWRNLSIPKSQAIQLYGRDFLDREDRVNQLESRLVLVKAALARPGLPDVESRFVWDVNGNCREEESVGSLRRTQAALEQDIGHLYADMPPEYGRPPAFDDRKSASTQLRAYPELSLAIRERLTDADVVFVLVTPFCRLREWVDFEISASVGTGARVVAVEAGGWISPDIRLDCHEFIPWDPVEIRRVVGQRSGLDDQCR